jgi:hypothetical protein
MDDEAVIVPLAVKVTEVEDDGLRGNSMGAKGLAGEGDWRAEGLLGQASSGEEMVGAVEPLCGSDIPQRRRRSLYPFLRIAWLCVPVLTSRSNKKEARPDSQTVDRISSVRLTVGTKQTRVQAQSMNLE